MNASFIGLESTALEVKLHAGVILYIGGGNYTHHIGVSYI